MRRPNPNQLSRHFQGDESIKAAIFPDATLRNIGHMVRDIKPIPGFKAVVNITNDETFAIVSDGYKLLQHQEVLGAMDTLCESFPEYGEPQKEMWMSRNGSRLRVRYTFPEVSINIGGNDLIHPTMESYASMDTTLAQRILVGAFRLVCTNGMIIGKKFGEYKRKHTEGLDLEVAKNVISSGLKHYSELEGLIQKMVGRKATHKEVFYYELMPFSKEEKGTIESEIRKHGKVLAWDEDPEKRKVEIDMWDMYNILTAETSHHITDIHRQARIADAIGQHYFPQYN